MNPMVGSPAKLLFEMIRIRMIEERIAELYPEQQMRCPVHLSIGQEAVAAGTCAALAVDDAVFSSHRSHSHYLAKGGNLKTMMAELYGKITGCSKGKGGSMHLIDLSVGFLGATPIVGSTIPIGVGAALGYAMRGQKNVTAVYFGEGATEEGVFHESVNFAVLKNLPVVFVCENNLYSVYSPLSVRQPKGRSVTALVAGNGLECAQGDGNDVLEVQRKMDGAVKKARAGGGPTFLEFSTYRWREHCGPNFDNNIGYRTEAEFLEWKKRCPIERTTRELIAKGTVRESDIDAMKSSIRKELDDAVAFAKSSAFPTESDMTAEIYAE